MSGDFMEWKLIREEYEEFITYLKSLASFASVKPPLPTPEPASKPNQPGAPLQTNAPNRTKNESDADQKRTEPEPKVENAFSAD
jgi:hypothetical protein